MKEHHPFSKLSALSFLCITLFIFGCSKFGSTKTTTVNGVEVGLAVKPAKPVSGENKFQISLKNEKGFIQDARVTVEYFMPAMGVAMPAMQGSSTAEPSGNGEYVATMNLPMEGNWTITVRATPPAGESVVARFGIRTGSEAITPEE